MYCGSLLGKEIDVVLDEPDKIYAIEIKSTHSFSGRDIKNLREFSVKTSKKQKKSCFI